MLLESTGPHTASRAVRMENRQEEVHSSRAERDSPGLVKRTVRQLRGTDEAIRMSSDWMENTPLSFPLLGHSLENRNSPERTLLGRETFRLELPGLIQILVV